MNSRDGLVTVLLIALVRHLARVEGGAAMGLVFTTMFALGVVMLEQSGARAVHLDVEHALSSPTDRRVAAIGMFAGAGKPPCPCEGCR